MPQSNENENNKNVTLPNESMDQSSSSLGSANESSDGSCSSSESSGLPTICCVGMCVLDIIHVCATYPVEDTDKRCLAGHMQRGGNASNMCTVLRKLNDNNIEFLGMMSTATGFEFLRSDCQRRGIIYKNCPTVAQNPPFSSVILVQNSDSRTIIHSNSNFPIFRYEHFRKVNLNDYGWFHFEARNPAETLLMQRHIHAYNASSTDHGVTSSQQQQRQQGRERIKISVEFEKLIVENLALALGADYIFMGKELACHMGWLDAEQAVHGLRKWIEDARKLPNIEPWQQLLKASIICPWGAVGTGTLNEMDEYTFIDVETPEKIVDALGAGDTFCAATISNIVKFNMKLERAVELANIIAGLKLSQFGFDGVGERFSDAYNRLKAREAARAAKLKNVS